MKQKKKIKRTTKSIELYQIRAAFIRVALVAVFLSVAIFFIMFARGYRLDFKKKSLSSTGILAISSSPKTAKVYINGEFRGVTDLNLNMPPGRYTVEIKKEGYIPYTKQLSLKGEIVEAVDPILFPINPSLSPVTNLGITKAIQLDDSDKMLIVSETGDRERDGVYMYESTSKPLNFIPPLKPIVLKSDLPANVIIANADVSFSNDFRQAVIQFGTADGGTLAYLVSLSDQNKQLFDVSTYKNTLTDAWEKQRITDNLKTLEAYPQEIRQIASDSFDMIRYSPDQTKILYKANKNVELPLVINPPLIASNQTPESRNLLKGHMYVYDMREDKNYHISDGTLNPEIVHWYNDSKRLVYREQNHIIISLYDGETRQTVYSGPIEQEFIAVNSDGKIMILANLNPASNKLPDLYQVGIR